MLVMLGVCEKIQWNNLYFKPDVVIVNLKSFYFMANKRMQRLKAIVSSRGKRHDERFLCYCCKVVHDRGWTYEYDGENYTFCTQCKEKLKVGHMLKGFKYDGDFESSRSH